MIKGRTLAGLAVAGVLLAGAAWYLGGDRAPSESEAEGRLLFPGLHDALNTIHRIEVTAEDGAFTLELQDGVWLLPERNRYPADTRKAREFLVGVAGLKIRSPKTANPALYEKLELNDPSEEGSRARAVVLHDAEGAVRASLIVGRRRPAADPALNQYFVRLADDPQTWLVEGVIDTPRTPPEWLARGDFLNIERNTIREVRVVHPDARPIVVTRAAAADEFTLEAIPEGHTLANQFSLNDIVDLFVDPMFDDVSLAAGIRFGGSKATMTTFDGLQVEMEQGTGEWSDYIRLAARVTENATEDAAEEATEDKDAGGDAADDADITVADSAQVRAEALNRRWQGWAWQLPGFRIGKLTQTLEQLIEVREKQGDESDG